MNFLGFLTASGGSVSSVFENIGTVISNATNWGSSIITWITGVGILFAVVILKLGTKYGPRVVRALVGIVKQLGK